MVWKGQTQCGSLHPGEYLGGKEGKRSEKYRLFKRRRLVASSLLQKVREKLSLCL